MPKKPSLAKSGSTIFVKCKINESSFSRFKRNYILIKLKLKFLPVGYDRDPRELEDPRSSQRYAEYRDERARGDPRDDPRLGLVFIM